jgi:hypothetical protein
MGQLTWKLLPEYDLYDFANLQISLELATFPTTIRMCRFNRLHDTVGWQCLNSQDNIRAGRVDSCTLTTLVYSLQSSLKFAITAEV